MQEDLKLEFQRVEQEMMERVALVVISARKRAALTRSQLSKKIGVSRIALEQLETGRSVKLARPSVLAKIAGACGGVFEVGIRFEQRKTAIR